MLSSLHDVLSFAHPNIRSVGIVIIAVISLLVRCCPRSFWLLLHSQIIKALVLRPEGCDLVRPLRHNLRYLTLTPLARYERLAWLPVLITFVIALGVGGKHLADPPLAEPATAQAVLSFGSVIAGFVVTYSPLSSDYTTYFHHEAPR